MFMAVLLFRSGKRFLYKRYYKPRSRQYLPVESDGAVSGDLHGEAESLIVPERQRRDFKPAQATARNERRPGVTDAIRAKLQRSEILREPPFNPAIYACRRAQSSASLRKEARRFVLKVV